MTRFKALRVDKVGKQFQAGLKLISLDDLTPGDALIKTAYSSINYKDALAVSGRGRIMRQYPLNAGIDVGGYVECSDNEHFSPGDAVLVCGSGLSETRDGGYSEYLRVPADRLVSLPGGLTLYEAMAMGTAGFSAALAIYQLLHNGLTVDKGPIAVSGASGGVGSLAIDMLSGLGYTVTAISRSKTHEIYLRSIGASQVLTVDSIQDQGKALESSTWAGVIDCVGGDLLSWFCRTAQPFASIASIGMAADTEIHTSVMPFILRGVNLLGINSVYCPESLKINIWQGLAADFKPRHLDKIVNEEIFLDQIQDYMLDYFDRDKTGRVVVKLD